MSLTRTKGGWSARLRFGQGRSARFPLPSKLTEDQAMARLVRLRELASILVRVPEGEAQVLLRHAAQVDAAGLSVVEDVARQEAAKHEPAPEPLRQRMTFRELGQLWTSGELARRYPDHIRTKRSVGDDKTRLALLYPVVGDVPVAKFTKEHAKTCMAAIPEGRSSATRRHYAQLVARMMKMAVWPLELIEQSPIPTGFLPRTTHKVRPPLYPSEDAKLVRCEVVPIRYRLLWGVLTREGMRSGEALSLRWRDLDLERGSIRLDRTKNGEGRAWALRGDVVRALVAFVGAPDELVFEGVDRFASSKLLRAHLELAGVDRTELFEETETRERVCVHSLRSTFCTVALACGATETYVMDRSGHKSSSILNRHYRKQGRHFAELDLGDLQPLDELLGVRHGVRHNLEQESESMMESEGIPAPYACAPERSRTSDQRFRKASQANTKRKNTSGTPQAEARSDAKAPSGAPCSEGVRHRGCATDWAGDPVEGALAHALTGATAAGRWEVVSQLATELQARREAREKKERAGDAKVIPLSRRGTKGTP